VLNQAQPKTIDIEMSWPPEGKISFLVQADPNPIEVEWDLSISPKDWPLKSGSGDRVPSRLYADIVDLVRSVWKEIGATAPGTKAYLRLHDSIHSTDLRTGRKIDDRGRPDFKESARCPVKKVGRSTRKNRCDGELIRRGDSLAKVKRAFKTKETPNDLPDSRLSQYYWPERGMRIAFEKDSVNSVVYFAPFSDAVCSIWIGAHAWEVEEILGRANHEAWTSVYDDKGGMIGRQRSWVYDVDGHLCVAFDRTDRVRSILR
jgi:hypothetical protein